MEGRYWKRAVKIFIIQGVLPRARWPHLDRSPYMRSDSVANNDIVFSHDHFLIRVGKAQGPTPSPVWATRHSKMNKPRKHLCSIITMEILVGAENLWRAFACWVKLNGLVVENTLARAQYVDSQIY